MNVIEEEINAHERANSVPVLNDGACKVEMVSRRALSGGIRRRVRFVWVDEQKTAKSDTCWQTQIFVKQFSVSRVKLKKLVW